MFTLIHILTWLHIHVWPHTGCLRVHGLLQPHICFSTTEIFR